MSCILFLMCVVGSLPTYDMHGSPTEAHASAQAPNGSSKTITSPPFLTAPERYRTPTRAGTPGYVFTQSRRESAKARLANALRFIGASPRQEDPDCYFVPSATYTVSLIRNDLGWSDRYANDRWRERVFFSGLFAAFSHLSVQL